MGDLGIVVLIIFTVIRLLIAAGIVYLIFYEVRRSRKHKAEKYRETKEDADRKDVDSSSGSRD